MQDNSVYRALARQALSGKWVMASVITLVMTVIMGLPSQFSNGFYRLAHTFEQQGYEDAQMLFLGIGGIVGLVALVWHVFVLPMEKSYSQVFLTNAREGKLDFGTLFTSIKDNYLHAVGTLVLCEIYVFFWVWICSAVAIIAALVLGVFAAVAASGSMASAMSTMTMGSVAMILFFVFALPLYLVAIIVAVMQALKYAMVPYLLCDYPEMSAKETLEMSASLMRGYRGKLFLLQLSFIGWYLLGMLCCCVGIYPASAYAKAAEAAFYNDRIMSANLEKQQNPY